MDRNTARHTAVGVNLNVALRKESVDRNVAMHEGLPESCKSLSARRAWIEIPAGCWRDARRVVALRKESVDRNPDQQISICPERCRSPQGERG